MHSLGRIMISFNHLGETGLLKTGYMHNRVRMIVGSLAHWSYGRDWFNECLVDADLANNTASWHGTGADAAPYFRIFNPVKQGQDFDKDGEYTKKYLPQLSKMPDKYLFNPWEAPKELLADAGVKLGENYPHPIVELKSSRENALASFDQIKKKKMRNLCVILADQLNQEIASLNDFDKDLDEILICELNRNFSDINHHKKKIVYQIACMRHFGMELDRLGFKINYLKLDNPDNENSYTSEIMKLIDNKGIDKVIVTEPSTYDEMESIQHWQKTIETDVEIRKNDLFFCGIDEFEAWAEGRKELRLEFFYRMLRRNIMF